MTTENTNIPDTRIVESVTSPPLLVFRSIGQADALLRTLEGRKLTDEQKAWLTSIADSLRLTCAQHPYGTWDGKADGVGTSRDPRPVCPHCHTHAKRVDCRQCTRQMCSECIH